MIYVISCGIIADNLLVENYNLAKNFNKYKPD